MSPQDQWRVARALRQRMADRLDENGIRSPDGGGVDVHTEPARDDTTTAPVPPADGSGGQPPTGPTDSDPTPR